MTPRTSCHPRPPVAELNPEPYYESFEITDRHGRVVTIEELEETIEGRLLNIDLPNGETLRYADERAALFFMTDRSAVGPQSYDAWVGSLRNKTDAITHDDLTTINRTMRARAAPEHWEEFITGTKVPSLKAALKALNPKWDLIEMPADQWQRNGCSDGIGALFAQIFGPYRRAAAVTKLMHLKRPHLIPICDSLVAETMGQRGKDAESTRLLVLAIRDVGRKNLDVLKLIAARLKSIGIDRTLVRILDALLWLKSSGEPSGAFLEELLDRREANSFFF